jgi:cobalt/nickel transport system permease protein
VHAPDGFLTAGTAVATGALSIGTVGAALRASRDRLADAQIPLAGVAAAFIFAAQLFNFPVAGGTSGHLLGGALAAVLLGPALGAVVVTVVVVVQALVFADGGLTALGYNVLNMAVVTTFGGWAVFRLARRLLPATRTAVTIATFVAAFASVLLSSAAFSLEWLFGASVPIPFDTVFTAMVGVHALIGVGEGVISALVVRSVLASRQDLVHGADDLPSTTRDLGLDGRRPRAGRRAFTTAALLVALTFGVGVSQFASGDPDGLDRVAADQGFADAGREHALRSSLFAEYATEGVDDERLSLALAGAAGTLLSLAVGAGLLLVVRERRAGTGGDDSAAPQHPAPADA